MYEGQCLKHHEWARLVMPNACVPADKSPKELAVQPALARMRARPLSNWQGVNCVSESP